MGDSCPKCGGPVVQTGQGRPSRYCSKGCRRAAEFEIRRIEHQLEDLEGRERDARENMDGVGFASGRPKKALRDELDWLQGEIARVEARFRSLLDESPEVSHELHP